MHSPCSLPRLAVTTEHEALVQHSGRNIDDALLLKESKIRDRLEGMVKLLREENETQRSTSQGKMSGAGPVHPCLEYLLENRVLEILCALGLADRPSGMMALVLQVLYALLKHISHPLLPHMSVHLPVCHIIRVCLEAGRGGGGPGELPGASNRAQNSLVSLLHTIWGKVREDPSQLSFFYEDGKLSKHVRTPQLLVFNGLLSHMHSRRKAGEKARESMLWAVQLQDERLTGYIAEHTNFCRSLVDGVVSAYSALPTSDDGADVMAGEDVAENARSQALAVFRGRLNYCAAVIAGATAHSHPGPAQLMGGGDELLEGGAERWPLRDRNALVTTILKDLRERFLDNVLRPALLEIAEPVVLAATRHARVILGELAVWGGALLDCFVRFLLRCPQSGWAASADQTSPRKGTAAGGGMGPDLAASPMKHMSLGPRLGEALLQHIDSQNERLSEVGAMVVLQVLLVVIRGNESLAMDDQGRVYGFTGYPPYGRRRK